MTQSLATTLSKVNSISNQTNASLIIEFDSFMKGNGNSDSYRNNNLKAVINYACWLQSTNNLTFFDIAKKEQIVKFLDTKIKPEKEDPERRWITTWNDYLSRLKFFFRWLFNIRKARREQDEIPMEDWVTPDFVAIKKKKTKRVSPYTATEIWELQELKTVVKYEPLPRNKAAIMMLWDFDARNHEVTLIELRNIRFKAKYAEGEVPYQAKTGSGPILLTASFPYVLKWYNEHPLKSPKAKLICDLRTGRPLDPDYLWTMMRNLRDRIQNLLKEGAIEDRKEREELERLLKEKKWNPYCIRHSAITHDSDYLPGYALNKKVRWTMNSKQPQRYIKNRLGNDLRNVILEHNGIISEEAKKQKPINLQCPKCDEINASENKYCSKCNYILSVEVYEQIKGEEDERLKGEYKEQHKFLSTRVNFLETAWKESRDLTKELKEKLDESNLIIKLLAENDPRIKAILDKAKSGNSV